MSHLSLHIQIIFKILWLALEKDHCINGRNNDFHFMKYPYGGPQILEVIEATEVP